MGYVDDIILLLFHLPLIIPVPNETYWYAEIHLEKKNATLFDV